MARLRFNNRPLRRSQAITPFGIGAMVDFPRESLMVAGLDEWREADGCRLRDERLERRLGVRYFVQPPSPPDIDSRRQGERLPAVRFPRWHQCPRCGTIAPAAWNSPAPAKCQSRYRPPSGPACINLSEHRRWRMVPLRFLAACEDGHIDDFPWEKWAHREEGQQLSDAQPCAQPLLRLYSVGHAGLSGLIVECIACDRRRSLVGAGDPAGLIDCTGNRPWLGPHGSVQCTRRCRMLQRRGSNVYFSKVASSILIPPYSDPIRRILDSDRWWPSLSSGVSADGEPDRTRVEVVAEQTHTDVDALFRAVRDKLRNASAVTNDNEEDYRAAEYRALLGSGGDHEGSFVVQSDPITNFDNHVQRYFERIVRVEKLAETRVLTGFSRINPPARDVFDQTDIGQLSLRRHSWLPAVRIYGEGVFLQLRQAQVEQWESHSRLQARLSALSERAASVARNRGRPPRNLPPVFFLLHALAHTLIRRLSFDCGYGSSALRERLYCGAGDSQTMAGLLIYTAAGDSEGTLGGLVQQARPDRFNRLLERAVSESVWCSSDPLCIESSGQGSDALNLAACHACLLLPETSCEEGNRLLDRACLTGTRDDPEVGYFSELVASLLA